MPLALLLAAAVSPDVPASDDAARRAITVYIESCSKDWALTSVAPNPEAIKRCIADDYQGVSSRGKVIDKAVLMSPNPKPAKAAGLHYAKPRFVSATLAVVRGEEWVEQADADKRHLIWTDIWVFRGGRWQIVASQDSVVPFDQPLQN